MYISFFCAFSRGRVKGSGPTLFEIRHCLVFILHQRPQSSLCGCVADRALCILIIGNVFYRNYTATVRTIL